MGAKAALTDAVARFRADNSNAFWLATLADCASPDSLESAGAGLLACVEQAVVDHLEFLAKDPEDDQTVRELVERAEDDWPEIADGAVPVYTHELWLTFVDLAAYNEDLEELGGIPDDLTDAAGRAVYMIADRLARVVAEQLADYSEVERSES